MTLDQMKYALEVFKTKQFSRAAQNCAISQPSLSVQVANLEAELGFSLFVRSRTGVEITEHGEEVLKQIRFILEQVERLKEIGQELQGEVQGQFRLGIISTLAPSLLPLFLQAFAKGFPNVDLIITEDRTENLVKAIDQGDLDGAILSTPQKAPESLLEKVLFYEPFQMFASDRHPLLEKKKASVEDLSSAEIILLDETHCLRDQVLQLCKLKESMPNHRMKIRSSSMQTVIEIIRSQPGYTLLPALSATLLKNSEQQKNLRSFEKPYPARKISLVFHRSRLKRSIIEALKETIMKNIPDVVYKPQAKTDVRILSPNPDHFEV